MQNAGMKTGCQKYVPTKSNCIEVSFKLLFDDALLMEFMYLVFTRMPGGSYCKWLRSLLLCLHEVFWAPINSLVCWFFILCMFQAFQYDNNDINTKYCVLQMMHENMDTPEGQGSLTVKTNEEIRWAHINSLSTVPVTRNLFFFTVWKSKKKKKHLLKVWMKVSNGWIHKCQHYFKQENMLPIVSHHPCSRKSHFQTCLPTQFGRILYT